MTAIDTTLESCGLTSKADPNNEGASNLADASTASETPPQEFFPLEHHLNAAASSAMDAYLLLQTRRDLTNGNPVLSESEKTSAAKFLTVVEGLCDLMGVV